MTMTRQESRSRIGIVWFDTEQEADEFAALLPSAYGADAIADANIGFAQCGRDRAFDRKDAAGITVEFAVVTP